MHNYDDDDENKEMAAAANGKRYEFHCISCDADNPYHDGFGTGDEITCFYCGTNFKVLEAVGKLRIKEV